MGNEKSRTMDNSAECRKQDNRQELNSPNWDSYCGSRMSEMMKFCPCGSAFKRHPLASFTVIVGIILTLVICQVGGILGVFAFFRTI